MSRRRSSGATRDINSIIEAMGLSETKWWKRNREVIRRLDEGHTVQEIAEITGEGQRQVRIIRDRLIDLRECEFETALAA